ncbi:MAG TPA: terminase [Noviherbaspirillum sp.]|nr:terminase [Noviherbaspirillum sp.]
MSLAIAESLPATAEELAAKLSDPMWRLCSGALYKIIIKGDEGQDDLVIPFKPNRAQRRFIARLWHRNIILKARQLGFTTLIAIAWLDHALFNANVRCGIIAQDRETAEAIFRDKVKFAYDNLPQALRAAMPLANCTKSEMLFGHNNSSIRVATSVRGGTIHRLHVSEFGKICAKFPDKASEVVTGSIPAVPKSGILVIESTAEGREGDFYDMTQRAIALDQSKKQLTERDYRFHFFPWWQAPEYRMEPENVALTDKDAEYFAAIEAEMGCTIDPEQRAWYVATRNADFSGSQEKMWQEYPSTPQEAFKVSTEGCYYTNQITAARKETRICTLPHAQGTPVNTFWDIGNSDGTAIWLHQRIGAENRFIRFFEGWGEPYAYFVAKLQATGFVFGRHYLPHDADHARQGTHANKSPKQMLEELWLGQSFEIVPRVDDVNHGIQQTRDVFGSCWFDETGCAEGLVHLEMYRKEWNDRLGTWKNTPRHDVHSEGADAFRQFGQAIANGQLYSGGTWKRKAGSWRTT